jgi:hypothetical protein
MIDFIVKITFNQNGNNFKTNTQLFFLSFYLIQSEFSQMIK